MHQGLAFASEFSHTPHVVLLQDETGLLQKWIMHLVLYGPSTAQHLQSEGTPVEAMVWQYRYIGEQ